MPDIIHEHVNLGNLNLHWPANTVQEQVFEFMQSHEMAGNYSGSFNSFVVTPIEKTVVEETLQEYIKTHDINSDDELAIRLWLNKLPDELVIAERK